MALLSSITLNTVPGKTFVNYPPSFLGLSILCVKRDGRQYKKVDGEPEGRQWSLGATLLGGGFSFRIKFDTNLPFEPNEKVFVIYKPIV